MATKIQLRRDTASDWTSTNPTLAAGEFGWESDTNKFKIGDGATAWTSLAYASDGDTAGITFVGDDSTGTLVSQNETFKIAGATGISTAVSGDTITITGTAQDFTYAALTGTPTIPSLGDISITNSTIASSGDTIDLDDIVRFNVGYKEDINALTSSASISVDATTAPVHTVTLAHAATFAISNMVAGQSIMIIITQDGTGSRTGSFTSVKFPGGAPTLSTGGGDIDVISVFYDGTNYLGNIAQDFTA